ncbi:MAG TPA: 23S rRNA (guanosine(2251)-2'-O)-methyltransferase RlmB [Sporichthyaceae bacterium]|jgi:23S rRNA (guanosine2251-2'-O)-methyltransferase|nr:23S rRNA (guanosine(2251)-2'-O)-methyltransferase RlmB [Sporichthyaceae bacterium]
MAGNSRRQGATRKDGSKKGAVVGSGGQKARTLTGRGPTPKASERTGHPAARRAAADAKREATGARRGRDGGPRARGAARPDKQQTEIVVGRNSVLEALQAGIPVTALYVLEKIPSDDRVRAVLQHAAAAGIPMLEAPRAELDRISGRALHQGLALAVPPYEYAHPDDLLERADRLRQPALIVALDGVTDPRNLGAILRSAEAFGGHGVLVPERRAAGMSAGAWKAAAGAGGRLPVARANNLTRALQAYRKAGLLVVVLDGDGTVDIGDLVAATEPLCLVVGSEGKGVSRLVGETADVRVRIPLAGPTESLNAGVAAGVALYEVSRQRATH